MKSARILAPLALAFAAAVIFGVRGQGSGKRPATVAAPSVSETPAATSPPSTSAPAPEQSVLPEIVFLEEAGAEPLSGRPRPTSQRLPTVNGNRRIVNARPITTKDQGEFICPRWSPDGLKLLVSRPGYTGLYTVGSNGGEIVQLTASEGIGFGADWNETGEIEIRTSDGERQRLKADGTPADSVPIESDSPRAEIITKEDTIFYQPAPGEAPIPISSGEDRYFGGAISPDGKFIAYMGLQTGIHIQPLDGSSPPVNVGAGDSPTWFPDSSGIVYQITQDDGHNLVAGDLYSVTVDGKTVSNLTQTNESIELHPSVSPDGTRIAFESDGMIYVGELQ